MQKRGFLILVGVTVLAVAGAVYCGGERAAPGETAGGRHQGVSRSCRQPG